MSEHLQCKIEQTSSTTDEHFDEKFLNGIEVVASPDNSPSHHSRLSPVCVEENRKRQAETSGNSGGGGGNGGGGAGNNSDDNRKRRKLESDDDDEDLNFFKSLVPHIRTIPSYEKISLRIKIMQCIQEYISKGKMTENYDAKTITPLHAVLSNTVMSSTPKQSEHQQATIVCPSNQKQTENGTVNIE